MSSVRQYIQYGNTLKSRIVKEKDSFMKRKIAIRYLSAAKSRAALKLLWYYVDVKRGNTMLKELNQVIDYIEEHLTDENIIA